MANAKMQTIQKDATQFSISIDTKNRLDRFKAMRKEDILTRYRRKKRLVTNSLAIDFLLDEVEKKR